MLNRLAIVTLLLGWGLGLATISGCHPDDYFWQSTRYRPGVSTDRHEFKSTVQLPLTIKLVEANSGTLRWQKDVPVNHFLVVDLDRNSDLEVARFAQTQAPATKLTYWLFGPDSGTPIEKEEIELPGTVVILKIEYRPAPEYPAGYTPTPAYVPPAATATPGSAATPGTPGKPASDTSGAQGAPTGAATGEGGKPAEPAPAVKSSLPSPTAANGKLLSPLPEK